MGELEPERFQPSNRAIVVQEIHHSRTAGRRKKLLLLSLALLTRHPIMASRLLTAFRSRPWRLALIGIVVAACCGFLLTQALGRRAEDSSTSSSPAPLYHTIDPAHNPERLTVIADARKIVGWISGVKDHAGEEVTVRIGKLLEKVKIEQGNLFTWNFTVTDSTRVEFSLDAMKQSITVQPMEKTPAPSVFFLADRHVYRPGQTLHVVGFLRQLNERGEFVPLTNKNIEVTLKTERKSTVVQRWKATSDEMGRFSGEYRFVEADPLDNYELSIPEYQGKLQVNLTEYRKSKVQLQITTEQKGSDVKLSFGAIDFMDRPLPAQKVTFTAQVVRKPPSAPSRSLKGEDFAHANNRHLLTPQMTDLSEEEQLLLRGDPSFDPSLIGGLQAADVAAIKGEISMVGKAKGNFTLRIPKVCQRPGHAVTVEAILVDGTGREVRQTQTFPLTFLSEHLKLNLAQSIYDIDEPIQVKMTTPDGKKVNAAGTVIAMRLTQTPAALGFGQLGQIGQLGQLGSIGNIGSLGQYGQLGMLGSGYHGNRVRTPAWQTSDQPDSVKRTLATAAVFKNDSATLQLSEPGAYKLIAIIDRPEGGKWQQEIGCLVQAVKQRTGVSLHLDRSSFRSGEPLTGILHSRFADARVLLTVRDSRGLKVYRTLTTDKNGRAAIKERLPADTRYGCVITAQYADGPDMPDLHIATQTFHVEPTDRMLVIDSKTKPIYGPSDKVTLDIQVNREEPVDLIVSVYDQALTNIKPTQTADIRSFYLADERAFGEEGRDILQRRLGGVTIESLLKKARKLTKDVALRKDGDPPPEDDSLAPYTELLEHAANNVISLTDIVTLLDLAGIKARWETAPGADTFGIEPTFDDRGIIFWPVRRKATLFDFLNNRSKSAVRYIGLLHDTFYLSSYDPEKPTAISETFGFRTSTNSGLVGGFGGLGMPGGNRGGLNQIGGIGQLGQLGQLGMSVLPRGGQQAPPVLDADRDQKDLFVRRDFSDSAYWNCQVRTDAQGKAQVEFKAPDSLTGWQVVVTGITKNMHVGQSISTFQVDKAIMVCPMLPRIFTQGDKAKVLGQVVNGSKSKQTFRVRLKVENGEVLDQPEREVTLEAASSEFVYWTFKPGAPGFTQLLMSIESPGGSDASLKRVPVAAAAVEEAVTKSGFCKEPAVIELPEGGDPATAQLEIRLAPTLMADLVDTLDYLVEYPYGCAEQTMSRFLPAIKVAQALRHFEIDHPGLKQKLPGCVAGGIKRLLELQQEDGGWGWNGTSEVHEMMTPYVLYGLLQAEKAGYVIGSEEAIAKGLNRVQRFIAHLKGRNFTTDRIFCMYVYGHRKPIEAQWWEDIDQHAAWAELSDQALALTLQMAVQHKNDKLASRLAELLRKRAVQQQGMVFWQTAGFSRWRDDPLEITAAALKALVMYDANDALIPGILSYFNATKRGNRWNSTKDTAMIVEALCEFLAGQQFNAAEKPRMVFKVNGGPAQEATFEGKALVYKWTVTGKDLRKGANTITFPEGTPGVMYRLILRHAVHGRDIPARNQGLVVKRVYWLLDDKGKPIREVENGGTAPRGSYLECIITANRPGAGEMRYVLLENPRPSGCEFIPEDDRRFKLPGTPYVLREERQTHLACHYEQTPEVIENHCILLAEVAGEFVAPPAQVELMYQTEIRGHSGTFRFKVVDP
jgi:alpha-2-macroglobulin